MKPLMRGCAAIVFTGIAPRQRGAWIETLLQYVPPLAGYASLPGNGGRGLKRSRPLLHSLMTRHRSPATGGVD